MMRPKVGIATGGGGTTTHGRRRVHHTRIMPRKVGRQASVVGRQVWWMTVVWVMMVIVDAAAAATSWEFSRVFAAGQHRTVVVVVRSASTPHTIRERIRWITTRGRRTVLGIIVGISSRSCRVRCGVFWVHPRIASGIVSRAVAQVHHPQIELWIHSGVCGNDRCDLWLGRSRDRFHLGRRRRLDKTP